MGIRKENKNIIYSVADERGFFSGQTDAFQRLAQ